MSSYETTDRLGQAMFGHAELGDRRRTARLVKTFDQMRRHPGGSLPDKLASPADLKALYRLCASPRVTHQARLGIGDRAEIEWFNGPHQIHGVGTFAFLRKHLGWPKP
jgi:hypothetical protein